MAPDGESFAVGYGNKGGTGEILDRLGQPVPVVGAAIPSVDFPIWADDNQHTCGVALDMQTLTSTLVTLMPGQAVLPVAVLGHDQGPNVGPLHPLDRSRGLRLKSFKGAIEWPDPAKQPSGALLLRLGLSSAPGRWQEINHRLAGPALQAPTRPPPSWH